MVADKRVELTRFFTWFRKFLNSVNSVCEDHAVADGLKIKHWKKKVISEWKIEWVSAVWNTDPVDDIASSQQTQTQVGLVRFVENSAFWLDDRHFKLEFYIKIAIDFYLKF